VERRQKCGLLVCSCEVTGGRLYCSRYCEQAAAQGVQREFCQCPHATCGTSAHELKRLDPLNLPETVTFMPGWVTIECSSIDHFREQLEILIEALDRDYDVIRARLEPGTRRRSVGSVAVPRAPRANGVIGSQRSD
jgi:hypothetical protein